MVGKFVPPVFILRVLAIEHRKYADILARAPIVNILEVSVRMLAVEVVVILVPAGLAAWLAASVLMALRQRST